MRWTAMISGYTLFGFSRVGFALYATMQPEALIATNYIPFVSLLQACAGLGALQQASSFMNKLSKEDWMLAKVWAALWWQCVQHDATRKILAESLTPCAEKCDDMDC